MDEKKKPWGGRFKEATDGQVEEFTASIDIDRRLFHYDIRGSIAHCKMLARQGIMSGEEAAAVVTGLEEIRTEMDAGTFVYTADLEDIHMAVERALIDRVAEAGEKLHTARSRNDQVALDVRLYLRDEIDATRRLTENLKTVLLTRAKDEIDTMMPGYTHLQKAQPVLLSHYLLAYWEMFERDRQRLADCYTRTNVLPLGSAALAGTTLPIDRQYVAECLDFPVLSQNSMDAVSDRDFVVEFIFAASLLMMHMSRLCEDLVVWSTDEFGFIEMSDAFTTGSSIMPQKKNPDVAELIRGKTGRVYGNLVNMLTILKGLPMTYNRDLQEDKEPLFDTVDTVKNCLRILAGLLENITVNRARMAREAARGFSLATDIAEYLVMKNVPFRAAHDIVGRLVSYCIEEGKELPSLSLDEFKKFSDSFDRDIHDALTVQQAVNARSIIGGTSKEMVAKRIADIESETK